MNDTREIPLTKGFVAIVDAEDYEWLNQWKWFADPRPSRGDKAVYAIRRKSVNGIARTICMHRLILEEPEGMDVDHIDGDGLNNTRANLRIATHQQNLCNRGMPRSNTSGFKGVCYNNSRRRWQAGIGLNGRNIYIGRFRTPEEAARAYDAKAKEIYGEFAYLNFPE